MKELSCDTCVITHISGEEVDLPAWSSIDESDRCSFLHATFHGDLSSDLLGSIEVDVDELHHSYGLILR